EASGSDHIAREDDRAGVGGSHALQHDDRIPFTDVQRGRLFRGRPLSVYRAMLGAWPHTGGSDRLGNSKVDVQVVAEPWTAGRVSAGAACPGDEAVFLQ